MDRSVAGDPPGILTLVKILGEHRAALEYDFRAKLHTGFRTVLKEGGWGEVCRLTDLLLHDPSSWLTASVSGWEYPITREDIVLRDLFDLQLRSKTKKPPQPLHRPWPDDRKKRVGKTNLPPEEVKAILRANRDGTLGVSGG